MAKTFLRCVIEMLKKRYFALIQRNIHTAVDEIYFLDQQCIILHIYSHPKVASSASHAKIIENFDN